MFSVSDFNGGTLFLVAAVLFSLIIRIVTKPKPAPIIEEEAEQQMARPVKQSELAEATGEEGKPLWIAVRDPFGEKVNVFDVSAGVDFYGPGGPYHVFVGKDATHGLATSSTDPSTVTGDLSNLTAHQKDTHVQWYMKYQSKYPIVGFVVSDDAVLDQDNTSTVSEPSETKKDA